MSEEARKLTAAEAVFSLDFVTKLVKKIHKDHPQYAPEQIAKALDSVFEKKLAASAKRLENIEKIRREYQILKSAQLTVEHVSDMLVEVGKADFVEHAMPSKAEKPKTNGATAPKADADQPSML